MTEPLLHLAESPLWEAARGTGTYEMSTRGRTLQEEGFIHLSLPHQLPVWHGCCTGPTTGTSWSWSSTPGRLADPVRYEAMKPGGEEFPHLYGPLPVGAVVEVRRLADWHHDRREEDEPQ